MWTVLACPSAAAYASYLQRHLQEPRIRHITDLYRLVRWMKRTPQVLTYRQIPEPIRLACVTDSSFSAGDTQGLVMRACCILLVSGTGDDTPAGAQQLVDWFSRKQPHVCRSTFAAELHAVLDGVNQALIVQSLLTEM